MGLKFIKMPISQTDIEFNRWKYFFPKHCWWPGTQVVYYDEILVDYDLQRVMTSQTFTLTGSHSREWLDPVL